MSRKVFVSYKYKDLSALPQKAHYPVEYLNPGFSLTRDYVDSLAGKIAFSMGSLENYLAWIGDAANNAAKMSEIRGRSCHSFITERLFKRLNANSKYGDPATKARCMWDSTDLNIQGQQIYESSWWWNFK